MKSTGKTRFLAIIISVLMIAATFPMGMVTVCAAPSGTAITSASEFAAMSADGTYYLANDITLTETYANEFKGTFDGKGRTVSTSVPMFGTVTDAVIENFNIVGTSAITSGINVEASAQAEKNGVAVGVVACTATNSAFKNITNHVSVTIDSVDTALEVYCGGILGLMLNSADKTTVTDFRFEGCVNHAALSLGTVNSNSAIGGIVGANRFTATDIVKVTLRDCKNTGALKGPKAAGMTGYIQHTALSVSDCTNSADLTATNLVGGIIAQAAGTNRNAEFINCVNSGNMGGAQYAGGIVGYINNSYGQSFTNCSNSGAITATKHYVGGILGAAATVKEGTTDFYGCVNSGAVTNAGTEKTRSTGGIVAYINANGGTVKNCVNTGTITGFAVTGGIVGNATAGKTHVIGCINRGDIYSTNTLGTSEYFGGVVAYMKGNGSIAGCVNEGNIEAASDSANIKGAGGIVGQIAVSELKNCYNLGNVRAGKDFAGGLAGVIGASASLSDCYTSGIVTGKENQSAIGQIGVLFKTTTSASVSNLYYNGELNPGMDAYALSTDASVDDNSPTTIAFTVADLASGKLAYDMNTAAGETVYYQNLVVNKDVNPVLDASHGTVIGMNGIYTSISVVTENKASVRIADDVYGSGMRFTSLVNRAEYDALISAGISENDITMGTVIAPRSFVGAVEKAGGRFTMADFDKLLKNQNKYLDVTVDVKGMAAFYKTDSSVCCFRGSVIGIHDYEMDFCAVGYIKVGDVYVYSAEFAVRNISDVAKAAYCDRGVQSEEYSNAISPDSANAIGSAVTYSPYTDDALTIIKGFFERNDGGNV